MDGVTNPLLNQLAKVYRVLGYEVRIGEEVFAVCGPTTRKCFVAVKKEITPNLCAEMKGKLRTNCWYIRIGLPTLPSNRPVTVSLWSTKTGEEREISADTEELAVLAAFLEVFRGGE